MKLNEYQAQALLSVAITEKNVAALAHRTLGLAGEAGEVASIVKKIIRDKNGKATAADKRKIAEKLGDTLYYVTVLAEYYDINLEDIANKNLEKSEAFRKSRQ